MKDEDTALVWGVEKSRRTEEKGREAIWMNSLMIWTNSKDFRQQDFCGNRATKTWLATAVSFCGKKRSVLKVLFMLSNPHSFVFSTDWLVAFGLFVCLFVPFLLIDPFHLQKIEDYTSCLIQAWLKHFGPHFFQLSIKSHLITRFHLRRQQVWDLRGHAQ